MPEQRSEEELELEKWKIKRLLDILSKAKGNGTSMISLIIPPNTQVSGIIKMLNEEFSTASNIKSRVNRLSVLSAIVSTLQRVKLYTKIPENGLCLYCGTILDNFNKEKKVMFDIQPLKPINTSLYLCDNKFHIDILHLSLEEEEETGFIILDGKGVLFGTLLGNKKQILFKLSVELPKKHGRGGQSALRFARLRMEKRYIFLKKVGELANQYFINEHGKVVIRDLILAGSGDFKNELSKIETLDQRLQVKIIQILDIAYGSDDGFNQAIDMCFDILKNSKFIKEKKIIQLFFEEIAKDSNKYVFGFRETLKLLEAGIVEKLLCWQNLKTLRIVFYNSKKKTEQIEYLEENEFSDQLIKNKSSKNNYEIEMKEKEFFLDWIVTNHKMFGTSVFLLTDRTAEGSQFVKGFGGIGGILRYKIRDYTNNE